MTPALTLILAFVYMIVCGVVFDFIFKSIGDYTDIDDNEIDEVQINDIFKT